MKHKISEKGYSIWLATVPVGCLVSPRKLIYLSPIWDDELHDWPLWNVQEVGVVVPPIPGQIGVHILAPAGGGICFADEVYIHYDPTKI